MTRITRRTFLRGAAAGTVATLGVGAALPASAATRGPQIVGTGRIGDNIPGKTIPSPSDFGFAADRQGGGTFVCSMYGPETGGFKGCNLMTIEGVITPNSLQIFRGTATFSGKVSIFASPDVFSSPPESRGLILNLGDIDIQVTLVLGGPGKASMILHAPAVTAAVGGDTGGIVEFGRIERRRIRA
jgi:hypothetical protein